LKKAIARWLVFFGCRGFEKRLFGELSSGQQLKVVLARALVHDPALVILDEPFSLLDLGARIRMYRYLEKLARRKGASQFILVTHHREDVLPAFSHGLLLKEGRIVAIGPRREVLTPSRIAQAIGVDKATAQRYFV
jgi:iron complex transport system ATP-binding protein